MGQAANTHLKAQINDQSFTTDLDNSFEHNMRILRQDLSNSPYFDRTILRNIPRVRAMLQAEQSFEVIEKAPMPCTFFNRNSDTLLVIGTGFPTPRELMAPFVHLFPGYDLILFDYHGQGLDYSLDGALLNPSRWLGALTYKSFGVDMRATGLGTKEEAAVRAIVNTCKQRKQYQHVYGLGLCYSAFIFVQAAVQEERLFDKLILDGSWPSLKSVIKKIAQKPSLVCARQPPSSPCSWLTDQEWFQQSACSLTEWLARVNLDTVQPLAYYLAQLTLPILFFQCIDDCYCSPHEFDELWENTHTNYKVAIFTHNFHGRNYWTQKETYAQLCTWFLESDSQNFIDKTLFYTIKS